MSLVVFPGVGDTVREPQWIWAAFGAVPLALSHALDFESGHWARLARALPRAALPWLAYLVLRTALDGFRGAEVLLFPGFAALGALVVCSSPVRPGAGSLRTVFAAVIALQLLFGALQALGMDPVFTRSELRGLNPHLPAGFTGHHTLFGLLMAWAASAWLLEARWARSLLCAGATLVTGSAFSLASLAAGALWAVFSAGYRRAAALAVLASFGAAFVLFERDFDRDGSFLYANGRFEIWVLTLKAWREKPWLGYGIGAFSRDFARYYQGVGGIRWREAHNDWLELLFNTGLVGLVLALPWLVSLAIRAKRLPPSPANRLAVGTLLVIGVNSFGNFPLQVALFAVAAIYSAAWIFCQSAPSTECTPR